MRSPTRSAGTGPMRSAHASPPSTLVGWASTPALASRRRTNTVRRTLSWPLHWTWISYRPLPAGLTVKRSGRTAQYSSTSARNAVSAAFMRALSRWSRSACEAYVTQGPAQVSICRGVSANSNRDRGEVHVALVHRCGDGGAARVRAHGDGGHGGTARRLHEDGRPQRARVHGHRPRAGLRPDGRRQAPL